jgi:hypothetical protein
MPTTITNPYVTTDVHHHRARARARSDLRLAEKTPPAASPRIAAINNRSDACCAQPAETSPRGGSRMSRLASRFRAFHRAGPTCILSSAYRQDVAEPTVSACRPVRWIRDLRCSGGTGAYSSTLRPAAAMRFCVRWSGPRPTNAVGSASTVGWRPTTGRHTEVSGPIALGW